MVSLSMAGRLERDELSGHFQHKPVHNSMKIILSLNVGPCLTIYRTGAKTGVKN